AIRPLQREPDVLLGEQDREALTLEIAHQRARDREHLLLIARKVAAVAASWAGRCCSPLARLLAPSTRVSSASSPPRSSSSRWTSGSQWRPRRPWCWPSARMPSLSPPGRIPTSDPSRGATA